MTRVLALVGLLALQFVLGNCDEKNEKILNVEPGSVMRLKSGNSGETVTKCSITTSWKKTYELVPNNTFPEVYNGDETTCSILTRVTDLSYAGVWTMETHYGSVKKTQKFIVKMSQFTKMRPTNYISASAGQYATVWVDSTENDNLTACYLKMPRQNAINLLKENVENMTRAHGCGVRFFIKKDMDAQWEITAQFGDYVNKTAVMQINVPGESRYDRMEHKQLMLGSSDKLEVADNGVRLCQFTKPDGTKLPFILGKCVYKIPSVSVSHNGEWMVSYSQSDKMELVHVKINVTVIDPNFMEFTSTFAGNSVNLMCKSGTRDLKFCTFIRPDNQVINVPAGIGNDKYSYYGQGYEDRFSENRQYGECGLTIHTPAIEDYGLWTCQMGVGETIRAGVINVDKTRMAKRVSQVVSPKVFVKRGDDFTIRCSANAVLNYCWLTDPSGLAYSVSPDGGSGNSLEYVGNGITMGECGAIVKNASDAYNGDWTCHLGIDKGAEIEGTVSVQVTDTYLIATEETVYAESRPTLSCRTFRDDEGNLQYCRWVRPNGHGINEEDASRYRFSKGVHDCSLTIMILNSEDIGQWRCAALLTGTSGNEEWATVDLKAVSDETSIASILSIVLGSGLLVIILIGAFFAAMHFYKRRNSRLIKSPPPYCPEDYSVPHGVQTGPEHVIDSKDYVY